MATGAVFLPVLPWESQYPALTAALAVLRDQEVVALEADHAALLDWLAGHVPGLACFQALLCVPALAARHSEYPPGFERDIPGRKWQQVAAFTACLDDLEGGVLEWCAGKAHLGRTICQRFEVPVTALERNPQLCASGNAMSRRLQLDVRLEQCDVLSDDTAAFTGQARHAVALHACGDLHRRLIELVAAGQMHSLHLSPCCYHLSASTRYSPFSQAGKTCGLTLSRDDCRLAVQETVTSSAAAARLREKKSAWRLGFDTLQRQLRGADRVPACALHSRRSLRRQLCRFLPACGRPEGTRGTGRDRLVALRAAGLAAPGPGEPHGVAPPWPAPGAGAMAGAGPRALPGRARLPASASAPSANPG